MTAELTGSPRERILNTATELFYAGGLRAVGIDLIIARAQVAKASFYRHFPAKDDLIVAFLEKQDQEWSSWLGVRVEELAPDPKDRPLAIFDAVAERCESGDFRGCPFINAVVEVADPSHPAHLAAERHRASNTAQLAAILDGAGWDGAKLAPAFALLVDGALVTALQEPGREPAERARSLAELLLRSKSIGS